MDEQREQLGKRESASVSDETIRLFLLCRLNEDERNGFEERLLLDDELEERVRLTECEIADDYAFGRLSAEEREIFTRKFLVTAERKQKLEVSQALRHYSSSHTVNKKNLAELENNPTWRERISGFFGLNRPALAFAIAFGALVLIIGIVWWITRSARERDEPAIVRQDTLPTQKPQTSPPTAPTPTPVPGLTTAPSPAQKTTPPPVEPAPAALVATAVLMPGALRDGGEMARITLPEGERDIVRLQLTLESNEAGTYRAELLTAEGQPISIAGKLKASHTNGAARVVFDVPARRLKAGDYQVRLSRQTGGQLESVGRYYFRALQ
jgi:hypothetical protein